MITKKNTLENLKNQLAEADDLLEITTTQPFLKLTDKLHEIREAARNRLELDPHDEKARHTALGIREFFRILKIESDSRDMIERNLIVAETNIEQENDGGLHGAPDGL